MPNVPRSTTDGSTYFSHVVAVSGLDHNSDNAFELTLSANQRQAIAAQVGALSIRKLRFSGHIKPADAAGWALTADLGTTVIQACVVTLAPVTTRIDVTVTRRFIFQGQENGDETDTEYDGRDDLEPLRADIDLGLIMVEALALALPDYPRAENAELTESTFAATGVAPLRDSDLKPFAALDQLKAKMQK